MTYTSHGHHINGTKVNGPEPDVKVDCGDIISCNECFDEFAEEWKGILHKVHKELRGENK